MKKWKRWQRVLASVCALVLTCTAVPVTAAHASGTDIEEIWMTEEEYREWLAYDREHHNDPVVVDDKVSVIHFPQQKMMKSSDLKYPGQVHWHGYDVGIFSVAGHLAFCIQHSKFGAPTGTDYKVEEWTGTTADEAKKILYYGFGGQKPWSGFEDDVHARVLTSLALSYYVEGRFSKDTYVWGTGKLETFINYCKKASLPDTGISLSKSELTAYVEKDVQRTEEITFQAENGGNTITLSIPKDVTLHYSSGASVTDGKAVIKNGEKFWFSAPLSMSGTYKTGDVTGSLKTVTSIKRVYPEGNNQDLTYALYGVDSGEKVSLSVTWLSKGKLSLTKASANPEITDNNACYSLAGAEYSVYTNENCKDGYVGKFTTKADGTCETMELDAGTYYVKETKAPKGYALDPDYQKVTVTAGDKPAEVSFKDLPQLDPVGVLLGKVDAETNKNKPQGSASLQGAQFTVKYYDGLWDNKSADPAELGARPLRTWVFETDEDGFCEYSKNDLYSGDALYTAPNGETMLPIGTITIQETKAPEGYLINPEVFVVQITSKMTGDEFVYTYNQPVIPENILKLDLVKKQAGTELAIPGAVFEHTRPDGTKTRLTTGADGSLTIKGLQHGKHRLQEISVMDGYEVNPNIVTFEVAEDNTIRLTSTADQTKGKITFTVTKEGCVQMEVEDPLSPFALVIHKKNEKDKVLAGAEFTLYSDKACSKQVKKGTTGKDGILRMEGLTPGALYYLKETKAPEGYRLPVDLLGKEIVYEIRTESTPVKDVFRLYVDGKEYTDNELFRIGGTKAAREIHASVVNTTGRLLPETGGFLFWMIGGGSLLLVLALLVYRKTETMKQNEKRRIRI